MGYKRAPHNFNPTPCPRTSTAHSAVAVIGIDIGKNAFHVVGLNDHGAIVLRQKCSRGQIKARLANLPPCLIGMEACVGAHPLCRKLEALGHDARLMPAKYVRSYSKGQKNDFRDAEAIAEAVQRPTMKFVATKTVEQLDLQALHRVRERLVTQRTGIINQIRAFLLERGLAIRQGLRFLRAELPRILATPPDVLSARMVRVRPKTGAVSMSGSISYPVRLPTQVQRLEEFAQRTLRVPSAAALVEWSPALVCFSRRLRSQGL